MTSTLRRVAVLGLGHIGGSLMYALRQAGVHVVGYDVDPHTASAASAAGFPIAATPGGAAHGAQLVVLAMPLPELDAPLREVAPHLTRETILTDVGTLKRPVLDAVRRLAPAAHFVGGHPLAGREETGWAAADPLLFRDAPWALTLEPDTELDDWLVLAELICDLGARPVPAVAAEQDAAVARVIGLPHVLAEVLALTGLGGGALALSLASGSYLSGSRVARTRPELVATWCDDNPALVGALDDAIGRLTNARNELAAEGSVLELARAGYAARHEWELREFEPVELAVDAVRLRQHGRDGGWITAVLRDADGIRLLGMKPRA
jgi:prephenate dehydrogenase